MEWEDVLGCTEFLLRAAMCFWQIINTALSLTRQASSTCRGEFGSPFSPGAQNTQEWEANVKLSHVEQQKGKQNKEYVYIYMET